MAHSKPTLHPFGKNKAHIIDVPSGESQSLDIISKDSVKSRVRSSNWSEIMDSIMLNIMTEEHTLGNFVNGSFTPLAWIRMVHEFNERTKLSFTKVHLQNRLKVLKRQFVLYQTLANKSGWGWDYTLNIPTAGDESDWEAIIAGNPAYKKCKDKPFPSYQAIEFLSGKATATGRHGFTSQMLAGDARSTSSSSPVRHRLDMESLGKNLEEVNDANSTSPTPTPIKLTTQCTDSASGPTSSMKRMRVSPPNPTPTSNRRRKLDGRADAMCELVELGRKRNEIAQTIMDREIQARPKIHSIEECMERLSTVGHLSPDGVLAACEALKDERNRPIFMTLTGDLLYMWIERQVSMQQVFAIPRPVAPTFPTAAAFFTPPSASYTPASSSFPPAAPFFPPTASTFPPTSPSFPPTAPSNPPEGPSFPPN